MDWVPQSENDDSSVSGEPIRGSSHLGGSIVWPFARCSETLTFGTCEFELLKHYALHFTGVRRSPAAGRNLAVGGLL
jgi:hypothetical protein